jgi:Tfp pilus assembly protein PilN
VTTPPITRPPTSLASQALAGPPAVVPTGPERREPLNLSRQPFVNTRPITRLALFLWIGGALLLTLNVALFWSYLGRSEQTRTALAAAELATQREKSAVRQASGRLDGLNLDRQNKEVSYLNRKIAERAFAWSVLFDRMATVLPDEVRLTNLAPQGLGKEPTSNTPLRPTKSDVSLELMGEAKTDEAVLQFVERLFNPPFAEPHLTRQEETDDGLVRFAISVQYLPDVPLTPPAMPAEATRPSALKKPTAPPAGLPRITRGVAHKISEGKP